MTDRKAPLIVAVSGGIDSVVLLHLLKTHAERPLIVAHVDHGMRPDSADDERFVSEIASRQGLPFVSTSLALGPEASEETARIARYAWLEKVRTESQADAIATAHHEDDVFETMVINLMRGTGWRGLCSLRETKTRIRPLLGHSKAWIIDYALTHKLEWREDISNESLRYLRNRIRHGIIPRLDASARQQLRHLYDSQRSLRHEIATETQVINESITHDKALARYPIIMVDDDVAIELLRSWLDESLEQSRYKDLLLFTRVARPGARWSLDGRRFVIADTRSLIVESSRD